MSDQSAAKFSLCKNKSDPFFIPTKSNYQLKLYCNVINCRSEVRPRYARSDSELIWSHLHSYCQDTEPAVFGQSILSWNIPGTYEIQYHKTKWYTCTCTCNYHLTNFSHDECISIFRPFVWLFFCVCLLLWKLDLGQEGSPYITLFRTLLQAFSQTSKTGHPEGMFSLKIIKD